MPLSRWSLGIVALAALGCKDEPAATTPADATRVAPPPSPPPAPAPSSEPPSPAPAPSCQPAFVRLYLTSWSTPDRPAVSHDPLWRAVRGDADLTGPEVQYLIEEERGKPWVGARVPSAAVGEKLVAAFKARSPADRPVLSCREPRNVRRLLTVGDRGPGRFPPGDAGR